MAGGPVQEFAVRGRSVSRMDVNQWNLCSSRPIDGMRSNLLWLPFRATSRCNVCSFWWGEQ